LKAKIRAGEFEPPILDVGCGDGDFVRTLFDFPLMPGSISTRRSPPRPGERRIPRRTVRRRDENAVRIRSLQTVLSNCVLEHVPPIVYRPARNRPRPEARRPLIFTVPSEHYSRSFFWILSQQAPCRRFSDVLPTSQRSFKFVMREQCDDHRRTFPIPACELAENRIQKNERL